MRVLIFLLFSTPTLSVSAQKKDTSQPKQDSVFVIQTLTDTTSYKLLMQLIEENIPAQTKSQQIVKGSIYDILYKNVRGIWYKIPSPPPAKTGKP